MFKCNSHIQNPMNDVHDEIVTLSSSAHRCRGLFQHIEGEGQCRKIKMVTRRKFSSPKSRQCPLIHHLQHITIQPDRPADLNSLIQKGFVYFSNWVSCQSGHLLNMHVANYGKQIHKKQCSFFWDICSLSLFVNFRIKFKSFTLN